MRTVAMNGISGENRSHGLCKNYFLYIKKSVETSEMLMKTLCIVCCCIVIELAHYSTLIRLVAPLLSLSSTKSTVVTAF